MKRWDRRALEGLPLRLLIMSLLVSLTVPVVMGSMESYERSTTRSMLVAQAEKVVDVVEEVMSAGEGNRRIITVSLPQSMDRFLLVLEIGGEMDKPSSLSVRCTCDSAPFITLVPEDPPTRMSATDGSAIRLMSGEHRLAIECVRMQEWTMTIVEVIE